MILYDINFPSPEIHRTSHNTLVDVTYQTYQGDDGSPYHGLSYSLPQGVALRAAPHLAQARAPGGPRDLFLRGRQLWRGAGAPVFDHATRPGRAGRGLGDGIWMGYDGMATS